MKFNSNSVEYKDILMFYRDNIVPYMYSYVLENNNIIKLIFKEEHVCKLLALDEFAPSIYKRREYLNDKGLALIETGKITSQGLKKSKPNIWREYKNRIEYFSFLEILLENPEFIVFNKDKARTSIKADVVLVYRLSGKEYIHLFCKFIDDESKIIIPVTFLIHRNTKYIDGQDQKEIIEITKEYIDMN